MSFIRKYIYTLFLLILVFANTQNIYVKAKDNENKQIIVYKIYKPNLNYYTYTNSYWQTINHYCSIYGCNSQQLYRVMMCESSGNPLAYNKSGASGLFQFMPNTWNYFSRISGIYGDIWDAEDQIHLAAWAFSNGLSYHWVCK